MLLLRSPFLVARLCSVSRVFKFLPVSPIYVASYSLIVSLIVHTNMTQKLKLEMRKIADNP